MNVTDMGNLTPHDMLTRDWLYYIAPPAITAVILVLFGSILLVGILGNVLVLIIIAAVKSMHTTVNRCLFSLALADLVTLLVLPVAQTIGDFYQERVPIGKALCIFLNMYDRVSCECSLLTFLYVSIDRYFALCQPFKSRRLWTGKRTYIILMTIWVLSFLVSIPSINETLYVETTLNNVTYYRCYYALELWFVWYDTVIRVFQIYIFILPLLLLYGLMIHKVRGSVDKAVGDKGQDLVVGRRGRGVKLLLGVIAVFLLSQLPFATLLLLAYHIPSVFVYYPYTKPKFTTVWVCRLLYYVNSASNPVLYFSLSTKFRQGFIQIFCCKRKQYSVK